MFSKVKDFFTKSLHLRNMRSVLEREIDNNITKSNWEKKSSFGRLGF